ncbi:DUF4239 domain-containing protein [Saccharopolyspora erythraea]|uniref:bestrophin-like domain n=1 Tax=Saccharopolyspora erythraea TaxID=1836 RepID=UPI001BA8A275|nr:DUF4239 domain-containing protein [Saccharopolyspora erythraea]QUH06159.1 DUF4239 domain-containing protein [Saccharopolyspora erythraea]
MLLVVVLPALLVAGLLVLDKRRKRAGAARSDSDSDSLSFVGGVLNALFTVVLAFYIVFAWQDGDDVEKASTTEANALTDTYWQVSSAPEPAASTIRSLAARYATRVAEHEWAALDQGRTDPEVDAVLASMRAEVIDLPADTEQQKSAREQALQNIRVIDENHRERVEQATDGQVFNTVLLVASIIGALIMVAFPLLIGISPTAANIATMVLLTLTLGFTIFVSLQLMHPLHGPFGVEPGPFRTALESFEGTLLTGA